MTIQPGEDGPLDVLRDCLRNGHPPECPNAQSALAQVEALVEAARLIETYDQAGGNEWWGAHAKLYAALAPFTKATP